MIVYEVRVMIDKQGRPPESILGKNTTRLGNQLGLLQYYVVTGCPRTRFIITFSPYN